MIELKRLQTIFLGAGWFFTIYWTIWTFFIYQVITPYDAYNYTLAGTLQGGISKAFSFFLTQGVIMLVATLLVLFDNRREREDNYHSWTRVDVMRFVLFGLLVFISIPWLLAVQGIYVSDIPILNLLFLGRQHGILGMSPMDYIRPAVHLGTHHGFTGFIFLSYAILFSIMVFEMKRPVTRGIGTLGVGFLTFYGASALLEDFILEQIIKRGYLSPFYYPIKFLYDNVILFSLIFAINVLALGLLYFHYWKNK